MHEYAALAPDVTWREKCPMPTPRKEFTVRSVRKIVIQNPAITVQELMEAAEKAGNPLARSTVSLARSQVLLIAAAREAGHWVD
jgi:hypothetical protein